MKTLLLASLLLLVTGCDTHHTIVIDQAKPIDINVNVHLDLVIKDARQDLEKISGEKPTNVVRPEDIGLPSRAGSDVRSIHQGMAPVDVYEGMTVPVMYTRGRIQGERLVPIAAADSVKEGMAARYAKVQALWDGKLVGESHGGLLVAKGTLSEEQQKLVSAENADRTSLYASEAKTKGVAVEEVALSYYIARLGYAKTGAWYEKMNQASKAWEWKQWGSDK